MLVVWIGVGFERILDPFHSRSHVRNVAYTDAGPPAVGQHGKILFHRLVQIDCALCFQNSRSAPDERFVTENARCWSEAAICGYSSYTMFPLCRMMHPSTPCRASNSCSVISLPTSLPTTKLPISGRSWTGRSRQRLLGEPGRREAPRSHSDIQIARCRRHCPNSVA
jgi:hypothetical protein